MAITWESASGIQKDEKTVQNLSNIRWDDETPINDVTESSKKPKEKGFVESVSDVLAGGFEEYKEKSKLFPDTYVGDIERIGEKVADVGRTGFNVAIEGIKAITPDIFKKGARESLDIALDLLKATKETDTVEGAGLKALEKGFGYWSAFKSKNPRVARDLENAVFLASMRPAKEAVSTVAKPVVSATKGTLKETGAITRDVGEVFARGGSPELAEQSIKKTVGSSFSKAINKTFSKKELEGRGIGTIDNYYQKATNAVTNIAERKGALQYVDEAGEVYGAGKLPETLNEFSQAIKQTKENVFREYDALAKSANGQGAMVGTDNIVKELRDLANKTVIIDMHPDVAKYASKMADTLESRGFYTAVDAQDAIKIYNQTIDNIRSGLATEGSGKIFVDSLIRNNLRKNLDDTISSFTGEEYALLKKQYGDLKEIEKDVVKAFNKDLTKPKVSFIEGAESILTSATAIRGLMNFDPSLLAAGSGAKLMAMRMRKLNNPNRQIMDMFRNVEKYQSRSKPFKGESKLFNIGKDKPNVKEDFMDVVSERNPTLRNRTVEATTITDINGRTMVKDPTSSSGWRYTD